MALRSKLILAASLITVASSAFAQDATTVPDHPRVNSVDQRLSTQQNRITSGVNSGTITTKQENRDERRDAKVSQQLSADEAKHNGHVTKKEDAQLNRELDRNSTDIKAQKTAPGAETAPKK